MASSVFTVLSRTMAKGGGGGKKGQVTKKKVINRKPETNPTFKEWRISFETRLKPELGQQRWEKQKMIERKDMISRNKSTNSRKPCNRRGRSLGRTTM